MILTPQQSITAPRGLRIQSGPQVLPSADFAGKYEQELEIIRREIAVDPRYADSLKFQSRSGVALEQRRDERSTLQDARREAWSRLEYFIFYYAKLFQPIVENENNNWDFYNGYQWDEQELRRIQEAKLIPHVSNYMSRWARTLIGEERGAETIYNFVADDSAFKPVTDLYNDVVPKICYMNEWADKSSSDFSNLSIGGRCFSSVTPDPMDPFRKVLMRSERPQEFMYDFENMQNGTGDGCNEMTRTYYRDLEELIWLYPEWEQYFRTYNFEGASAHEMLLFFQLAIPKVAPTAGKRAIMMPATFTQRPFYRHRKVAWVTEHFTMGGEAKWSVTDFNFNNDHDFDAPDQAAYFYRNLRDAYLSKNVALTGQPGIDLVAPPERVTRKVVDKEVWVADTLVDIQTLKVSRFPYIGMHNEFHRGEWRGFFQDDKSNQQLRNRMLIYWDMLLGGVKGKTGYDMRLFPKGTTTEQAEAWARDPNKILISDFGNKNPKELFWRIDPPNHGSLPQVIMSYVDKASAFGNGGLNSIGDAEFAGQSDKLRRGLQESAQTGVVPIMKDWSWHERRVGEHVRYVSQFLHPVALLGYVNSENRETVIPVLQNESHMLDMDSLTCQVEEVLAGPRKRNQQKATLVELATQDKEGWEDYREEILRMEDLPQSMLDRIEKRRQSRQEAQSAAMQHEQQMAEYAESKKWEINERKVQVEEGHLDVAKNPPVTFAVSAKANAPGPAGMAEIYKQHGIDAEPAVVLASEAQQDLKDQARDNLRQQSQQKIALPYEQALAKYNAGQKAKAASQNGGVRSAKDRSSRSRKGAEK